MKMKIRRGYDKCDQGTWFCKSEIRNSKFAIPVYHAHMRLTLVTETFAPEVNGVAMTLMRWSCGLAQRGHAFTVVRPRQKSDPRNNGAAQQNIHVIEPTDELPLTQMLVGGAPLPGYQGLQFGFPAGGFLKRQWRLQRPDVVHVATEGPLGWSAVHTARRMKIPVVSSFHTNFHSYGKHYGIGRLETVGLRYLTWLHNQTAATFVPTHEMRSTLRHDGLHGVRVLARGVDTTLYHPGRRSDGLRHGWGVAGQSASTDDATDFVVGYVGRLAPEKNIKLAVRAYQGMVGRTAGRLRFVLVGDGPSRATLQKEHPDFIFCGMQRGPALAEHYASLDLLLFPSITETFGNVVTEAMASGVPVVAFDYAAAHRHIVHEHNGLLAPFNDAQQFVHLSEQAITQADQLRRMGALAHTTAQRISWSRVVDKYERMLKCLCDG